MCQGETPGVAGPVPKTAPPQDVAATQAMPCGAYREPAGAWRAPGWEEGLSARTCGLGSRRGKRMMKRRSRKREEEREDREAVMGKHPVYSHYYGTQTKPGPETRKS